MKKAIDISMDFTAALVEAQRETLANLDDLARQINTRMKVAKDRGEWLAAQVALETEGTVEGLTAIREEVLAIRAQIADGSDDGARIVAEALASQVREAAE